MKSASKAAKTPEPWRCPKCDRQFARKSSFHSCGQYTLEGYLAGKNPQAVQLFHTFVETARQFGEVEISPTKTQISLRARTTFAMVAVTGRQITGYLFLTREIPAPFFRKIAASSQRRFVHVFRLTTAEQITGALAPILAEAISTASDHESNKTTTASAEEPRIGEQINALYRQLKTQVAARP